MVVWNKGNKLRTFGYTIDGLGQSDLVEGRINTTNINKPNQGDNNGLLSNNGELGIWRNLVSKTL